MSRLNRITSDDRLLVLAPHPDDEALGAGGLIQCAREAHAAVRVVFITDGDNNPWPQRAMERRWTIGPHQRATWGARRREEAFRSIDRLGLSRADAFFWGLPDQGLTAHLLNDQPAFPRLLQSQFDDFSPTIVIGPSIADHHPDHSAASVWIRMKLGELRKQPRLYEYLIHGRVPAGASGYTAFPLSPQQVTTKREAVRCHRSQTKFAERRLMACISESELFHDATVADMQRRGLSSFSQNGHKWTLTFSRRRWFDCTSHASLDMLVVDCGSIVTTLRVPLATRCGRIDRPAIFDRRSGELVSRGSYDSAGRLVLPAIEKMAGGLLYVKRSGGIAFFDESGWTQVALKRHDDVESVNASSPIERTSFAATAVGSLRP